MSKATDRQQLIIEQLSDRRSATVPELMAQFNVSRCTILRDIETPDRTISALLTIEMSGCGRTWIMRKWLADTRHSI